MRLYKVMCSLLYVRAVITLGAISQCLFRCRPVCLLLFCLCTCYATSFKGSIFPEMEKRNIDPTLIVKTITYG